MGQNPGTFRRALPVETFAYRSLEPGHCVRQALGPEEGLAELRKIPDRAKLKDYPFYPVARGEFHFLAGRPAEAGKHFEKAMKLARSRSRSEMNFFDRKLKACR